MVRLIPLLARRKTRFIRATYLTPQEVVDVDGVGDATRDTYQRKVFYDGANFFVVYWESDDKQVKYVASADGQTWSSPTVLWTFAIGPYYGGNIDIQYPNKGAKDSHGNSYDITLVFSASNGNSWNVYPFVILGQTLSLKSGWSYATSGAQGGSIAADVDGVYEHWTFHVAAYLGLGYQMSVSTTTTEVPYGGTTVGGAQIVTYKTESPYDLLVLAKGSDNKLYYWYAGVFEVATLGTGFSDFCACSEAQNIGDPERIHMVYIKSTGELCYRKFANETLGDEVVLVESGASYPVIAAGKGGKLYVFYVKDGKIKLRMYLGSWHGEIEPFKKHAFNTPTYLSTNQNVQHGRICLVWTEGTASPYEVWFAYLID